MSRVICTAKLTEAQRAWLMYIASTEQTGTTVVCQPLEYDLESAGLVRFNHVRLCYELTDAGRAALKDGAK